MPMRCRRCPTLAPTTSSSPAFRTQHPTRRWPCLWRANGYLTSNLAGLSLDDTNVYFFSYLDFFARLRADPTQFGLPADLQLTGSCLTAGAVPGCSNFFSFDGVHPTAAVQRAVFEDIQRQFGFAAPVPEPATWMMLIIGFAFVGGAMRRRVLVVRPATA